MWSILLTALKEEIHSGYFFHVRKAALSGFLLFLVSDTLDSTIVVQTVIDDRVFPFQTSFHIWTTS